MLIAALALLLAASAPETAFRTALNSEAEWKMTRRLPNSYRNLVSSGEVRCRIGEGILWKTLKPFENSVEMTTNSMVFVDEEGTRVKPLSELPHYEEIRRRTDAFAAGDAKAFDGLFKLERVDYPDGGWKLVMKPQISEMERMFRSVEVFGSALPTNVVMRSGDGGVATIEFREKQRAQ